MARNTSYNARQLTGYNIYHNHDKNQTIYYDMFTKTGYIITNQYVANFSTWQIRLPLAIMASAFLVLFNVNLWLSILIGVATFAISTILFHTTFLKKLPVQVNFVKPKSLGIFRDIASRYPTRVLNIITIMFLAMATVMIVNQLITKYEGAPKTITIIFSSVAIVASLLLGYIAYLKKKENL